MNAATARKLMTLGLTIEQLVETMEAEESGALQLHMPHDAVAEKRRAYDRERKAAARQAAISGGSPVESPVDAECPPSEVSPHTPLPNYPIPSLRSGTNGRARIREGWPADYREQFWAAYPSKTAKKAGLKALDRIAASPSAPEWPVLLAGLERYVRTKPNDWAWAHAATWLNGERWTDEPAEIIPINRPRGAQNGVREATDILRDSAAVIRAEISTGPSDGAMRHDARFLPRPG